MLQLGMLIICALATCQRDQTIKFFNLDYIKIPIDKIVLFVPKTLKTTKQDHHLPHIERKTFKDIDLCVVAHLEQYFKMTVHFRNIGTNQLLLSFVNF